MTTLNSTLKKSSFLNNSNTNEYFFDSSMNDEFIYATISKHEIITEEKFPFSKFVLYQIDLITSIKTWSINKRYSQFEDFRKLLKKKITNMPPLPEKKIFSNTSDELILERKLHLSAFLNCILTKEKVQYCPEILRFIEIDKETVMLLFNKMNLEVSSNSLQDISLSKNILLGNGNFQENMKNNISNNIDNPIQSSQNYSSNENSKASRKNSQKLNNYYYQFLEYKITNSNSNSTPQSNLFQTINSCSSPHWQLIEEFLKNLEMKSMNKSSIIKNFESFLKINKTWPTFKNEEISLLFFGIYEKENDSFEIRGLLSHIGDVNENSIGSEACISFLLKLVDCEYNPEYERYSAILKQMNEDSFVSMNLSLLLEECKINTKNLVFKLLDVLCYDKNLKFEGYIRNSGIGKYYELHQSINI